MKCEDEPAVVQSIEDIAESRRAANARAICLTLAIFSVLSIIPVIPRVSEGETDPVVVGLQIAAALIWLGSYVLARRGRVVLGMFVAMLTIVGQHVAIVSNTGELGAVAFFACILLLIASATLSLRWFVVALAPTLGAIAVEVSLIDAEVASTPNPGDYATSAVVLSLLVFVFSFLHLRSTERAFALASERERQREEAEEAVRASEVERQQAARELEISRRMEALGRLAGGVAHDFNNLLMIISGATELAASSLEADHPAQEDLGDAAEAAARAAALTKQLLAFSRKQAAPPSAIRPAEVVVELASLLQRFVGEDVELELELAAGVPRVVLSPTNLEQLLVNFAVNARDAMPAGGRFRVELRGQTFAEATYGLEPGTYLEILASDTGTGIEDEVLPHLFEPFFSTKASRGTGLGLATCYGIARQAGGTILVETKLGEGTTLRVLIPQAVEGEPRREGSISRTLDPDEGGEILVVDDEAGVRRMVNRMLRAAGYLVQDAANLGEAREALARDGANYVALITDIVLGDERGTELLDEARERFPEAALVVVSGYDPDPELTATLVAAGAVFLAKPFAREELLDALAAAEESSPGLPIPG